MELKKGIVMLNQIHNNPKELTIAVRITDLLLSILQSILLKVRIKKYLKCNLILQAIQL